MRVTHSVSRRQFLQTTAGFAGSLLALAAAGGTAAPAFAAPAVFAQTTPPDVPRNRTMISAGLGGEMPGGYTDIDNFNPFSPGLSRSGFYQAATEPLFYYNMLGDDFTPWLAEGYSYTPDNLGLTLNLRTGPTWSDGTPFTSKDVAFTLTTMKNNPDLLNAAEISRVVAGVTAPDDKTVNITFTEPSPRFHWNFLTFRADIGISMLPQHVWDGQDPHTFKNYDPSKGWPLGTGPYKLVSTDVQQKSWDLRPDWWAATTGFKPLPQVQRLTFLPGMNEITMAQMLIANQIDIAFSLTPGNLRLVQSQNPNIITHSSTPPYGYMDWWPISLAFNTTVKPFDDPEIRWAISYAIDRDEIVSFAFQGFSQPAPLPYPPYPGLQKYFDGISDLTSQYPTNKFDPSQTDAIMGRKGYTKNSDGMWVDSSGQKISFQIVTFPQHPSTTPQAPIVAQQLKKAGFDASFLLPADFYTRITSGDAVAYLWGHGGSMNDPFDTLDIYNIRYVKPAGQAIFNGNIYRWSNQEYSAIVDKMRLLPLNDPQVMDLWHQAMAIWLPNLPDVQLIQTVIAVPMNTTYWTNWPQGDHPVIHEGFWHRTADLMFETLKPVQQVGVEAAVSDVKLEGKVALVTGGGGGMGGAQARLFAREGAAVCVADLFIDKANAVAGQIEAGGGRALGVELDVQKSDQWAAAVAATESAFGPVSILCNNAGANFRVTFDDQTEEMWGLIVGTILTGSFLGTKAVIPSMRRAGGGVIVNLGSLASIRPGGSPGYGAAKMGLVGLTRSTAASYAADGIRCVLVSPGHVDTPFIRDNSPYSPNDERTSLNNPDNYNRRLAGTPLGRLQTPDDIAETFLFVVSDAASMITGSMITVDGGAGI